MLAILGTFGLQSQEKLSLDLAAARKYALEYNKVLAGSGYAVDKARMELREAIANGLPQVGASMEYTNALGASLSIRFNENLPATEIDIKPTANAYINVNQLIFSGNYIVGVQMARLSKSLSEIQYRKSELEVISQVSNAYYLAQMAREMRALLERGNRHC